MKDNFLSLALSLDEDNAKQETHATFFKKVKEGDLYVVETLFKKNGIDIDYQDKFGNTALIISCWDGDLGIVKFLLENGANKDLRNKNNKSALCHVMMKMAHLNDLQNGINSQYKLRNIFALSKIFKDKYLEIIALLNSETKESEKE